MIFKGIEYILESKGGIIFAIGSYWKAESTLNREIPEFTIYFRRNVNAWYTSPYFYFYTKVKHMRICGLLEWVFYILHRTG